MAYMGGSCGHGIAHLRHSDDDKVHELIVIFMDAVPIQGRIELSIPIISADKYTLGGIFPRIDHGKPKLVGRRVILFVVEELYGCQAVQYHVAVDGAARAVAYFFQYLVTFHIDGVMSRFIILSQDINGRGLIGIQLV